MTNLNTGGTSFDKPVDNIGMKTISDYVRYGNRHVWDVAIPGCTGGGRVFVGQRKDPFVVNLGETFDLVNIKYPAVELNPAAEFATVDTLSDKNVTSIITGGADRVPHRRQGHGHRRVDDARAFPQARCSRRRAAAASIRRRKAASTCRSRASACRW